MAEDVKHYEDLLQVWHYHVADDAIQNVGYHQAFRWAKELHSNGDNTRTKLLADCYRYGYGVRRDRKRARELYRQAAENGNDEARKILEKW